MNILDLPTEQIQWLELQINMLEREAYRKGYLETVLFLDNGKICNLIDDSTQL